MIALVEDKNTDVTTVISAEDDKRLRDQVERLIGQRLSSSAWAKAYVDLETIDVGYTIITLFRTDSVITIKPHVRINLHATREDHNLKPLDRL